MPTQERHLAALTSTHTFAESDTRANCGAKYESTQTYGCLLKDVQRRLASIVTIFQKGCFVDHAQQALRYAQQALRYVSGLPPGFSVRQNVEQSWLLPGLLPLALANLDIQFKILHYSLGMSNEIRHLFVTLKRSFAGTRETHINTVRSLGLRQREQTVQKANVASVRGAIDKVLLCSLMRHI